MCVVSCWISTSQSLFDCLSKAISEDLESVIFGLSKCKQFLDGQSVNYRQDQVKSNFRRRKRIAAKARHSCFEIYSQSERKADRARGIDIRGSRNPVPMNS